MQEDIDKEMDQEGIEDAEINDEFNDEFDDDADGEDLTIVEKIIGVFVSPVKTFNYIAEKPDFWWPLIIISLLMIGASVLALPNMMPLIQEQAISSIADNPGIPEAQKEEIISEMAKWIPIGTYIQVGLLPIFVAISWGVSAGLIFIVSLVMGLQADFKKLIGVIPWLSFISVFSEIFKNVYIFTMKEAPDKLIENPALAKPFSAAILVANNADVPVWIKIFLSSIDPFVIWSLIIMVVAVEAANECTRKQAITTVVIVTIIGAIITIGLSFMQGLQVTAS